MARKKKTLVSKLGSWTDQANLTRSTSDSESDAIPSESMAEGVTESEVSNSPKREEYLVSRSLIERLADTAKAYQMSQNQVIGYLLTWALDQVDAGKLEMAKS